MRSLCTALGPPTSTQYYLRSYCPTANENLGPRVKPSTAMTTTAAGCRSGRLHPGAGDNQRGTLVNHLNNQVHLQQGGHSPVSSFHSRCGAAAQSLRMATDNLLPLSNVNATGNAGRWRQRGATYPNGSVRPSTRSNGAANGGGGGNQCQVHPTTLANRRQATAAAEAASMAARRMLTVGQPSNSRLDEDCMHTSSLERLLSATPKSEEASHPSTQMGAGRTDSQQTQGFSTNLTRQHFMRTRRGESCSRSRTDSQVSCDDSSPPMAEHEIVISPETWKAYVESFGEVFESTWGGCSLALVQQPELQHRARYLTEGSRGPIKNRTNDGHPRIQLRGWNGPALLQVFVANDSGDPKLNMFYQVCLVSTKSNRGCTEKTIGHTTVVQVPFNPDTEDRTLDVDCVGLVKLRNSDVERRLTMMNEGAEKTNSHRGDSTSEDADMKEVLKQNSPTVRSAGTGDGAGETNRKSVKPKSSSARLVYRVLLLSLQKLEGVVQVISDPILCTQIVGSPEICLMSTREAPEVGGGDLFIIGKNLVRGSRIVFRELSTNTGDCEGSPVLWEREADLDSAYLYQTHAICRIPRYDGPSAPLIAPLRIVVFVETPARVSRPENFVYLPSELPLP
ncbi:hypothetical protein AAHC03_017101 [Spirometra sp. Aus1]